MSRFNAWADSDDDQIIDEPIPVRRQQSILTQQQPPKVPIIFTPNQRTQFVQVPIFGGNQRPIVPIKTVNSKCVLMKGQQEGYADLLESLPDLAADSGIDYANGVDAVADLTSTPENSVFQKWTPRSRYFNGTSDASTQRRLSDYISNRYGDSVEGIRSSKSSIRR